MLYPAELRAHGNLLAHLAGVCESCLHFAILTPTLSLPVNLFGLLDGKQNQCLVRPSDGAARLQIKVRW